MSGGVLISYICLAALATFLAAFLAASLDDLLDDLFIVSKSLVAH